MLLCLNKFKNNYKIRNCVCLRSSRKIKKHAIRLIFEYIVIIERKNRDIWSNFRYL